MTSRAFALYSNFLLRDLCLYTDNTCTVSNKVRIIGGAWRSRIINFPTQAGLRPTPDRVRETLFNWLGQNLAGKTCLDLFAGSGALGFEACSRGAQHVTLIEQNTKIFAALCDNAAKLGPEHLSIRCADGAMWLRDKADVYDVIFLDPPFQSEMLDKVLPLLPRHLTADGCAYVESGAAIAAPAGMQLVKNGRTSQIYYGLLTRIDDV